MKTLVLETSGEKNCILLAEKGIPLAVTALAGGPDLSKQLAKEVSLLLDGSQPDRIAIGTGPGSFTGIRVGAALAKALAYGWQIPIFGFCSLKAFAPPSPTGPFAILADARTAGFYALFGDGKQFQPPALIAPTDPILHTVPLIASPHPQAIQKKVLLPAVFLETSPNPQILAALAEEKAPLELSYFSNP